jgi:CheY-like chemotaxis protein
MSDEASILVVDDEKTLREIVSRALTKLGHRCATACNGQEALLLAGKQAFDLVLTDLRMPKMDGLALIEWLRRWHPGLPIIIMTGYADLESARKALRLQVADYLVKPFESLAEVQAAVRRALETRTARSDTQTLVKEFEARALEFGHRERHLTRTLERTKVKVDSLAERLDDSETLASRQATQIDSLIDNLENGILVTDAGGVVLSMNNRLRRQLQAASSHGTGFSVDRLPGDSVLREAMIESRERLRTGGEEPGAQEPVLALTEDMSGEQHTYEVRSAALAGQGGVDAGILTIVRPMRLKPVKSEARAPAGPDSQPSGQCGRRTARALVARWGS